MEIKRKFSLKRSNADDDDDDDEEEGAVQNSAEKRSEEKAKIAVLLHFTIKSVGCFDPPFHGSRCDETVGSIVVNQVELSQNKPGFNFVVIDFKTGELDQSINIDTHGEAGASQILEDFLSSLEMWKIVCVAVKNDAENYLPDSSIKAFGRLGARSMLNDKIEYRSSYAFIGLSGPASARKFMDWEREESSKAGKGPSVIRIDIKAGMKPFTDAGGTINLHHYTRVPADEAEKTHALSLLRQQDDSEDLGDVMESKSSLLMNSTNAPFAGIELSSVKAILPDITPTPRQISNITSMEVTPVASSMLGNISMKDVQETLLLQKFLEARKLFFMTPSTAKTTLSTTTSPPTTTTTTVTMATTSTVRFTHPIELSFINSSTTTPPFNPVRNLVEAARALGLLIPLERKPVEKTSAKLAMVRNLLNGGVQNADALKSQQVSIFASKAQSFMKDATKSLLTQRLTNNISPNDVKQIQSVAGMTSLLSQQDLGEVQLAAALHSLGIPYLSANKISSLMTSALKSTIASQKEDAVLKQALAVQLAKSVAEGGGMGAATAAGVASLNEFLKDCDCTNSMKVAEQLGRALQRVGGAGAAVGFAALAAALKATSADTNPGAFVAGLIFALAEQGLAPGTAGLAALAAGLGGIGADALAGGLGHSVQRSHEMSSFMMPPSQARLLNENVGIDNPAYEPHIAGNMQLHTGNTDSEYTGQGPIGSVAQGNFDPSHHILPDMVEATNSNEHGATDHHAMLTPTHIASPVLMQPHYEEKPKTPAVSLDPTLAQQIIEKLPASAINQVIAKLKEKLMPNTSKKVSQPRTKDEEDSNDISFDDEPHVNNDLNHESHLNFDSSLNDESHLKDQSHLFNNDLHPYGEPHPNGDSLVKDEPHNDLHPYGEPHPNGDSHVKDEPHNDLPLNAESHLNGDSHLKDESQSDLHPNDEYSRCQQTMDGSSKTCIAECNDNKALIGRYVIIRSSDKKAVIKINGDDWSKDDEGFNIVVLDFNSGEVEATETFDTVLDGGSSKAMVNFLRSLTPGKVVMAATKGDAGELMIEPAYRALEEAGGKKLFLNHLHRGDRYVAMGITGARLPWSQEDLVQNGDALISTPIVVGPGALNDTCLCLRSCKEREEKKRSRSQEMVARMDAEKAYQDVGGQVINAGSIGDKRAKTKQYEPKPTLELESVDDSDDGDDDASEEDGDYKDYRMKFKKIVQEALKESLSKKKVKKVETSDEVLVKKLKKKMEKLKEIGDEVEGKKVNEKKGNENEVDGSTGSSGDEVAFENLKESLFKMKVGYQPGTQPPKQVVEHPATQRKAKHLKPHSSKHIYLSVHPVKQADFTSSFEGKVKEEGLTGLNMQKKAHSGQRKEGKKEEEELVPKPSSKEKSRYDDIYSTIGSNLHSRSERPRPYVP